MQRIVGNVRVNINKSKHALAAVSKMGNLAETVGGDGFVWGFL